MFIDGDTHYWPLGMIERVTHPDRGHLDVDENVASFYRDGKLVHSFRNTRWDLRKRYQVMDQEGFDLQVLIPDNRPLVYEMTRELGIEMARSYNDAVATDLVGHNRFISVAWVYLPDVNEAIREARRAVEELGFCGVKLMGAQLDDRALWPFYEELARLDVPLLVHPAARLFADEGVHPAAVGSDMFAGYGDFSLSLSLPFTYQAMIMRLIFGGVLDAFPTLRFAFFEGGVGWVPFLMNRLDHQAPRGQAQSSRLKTLKRAPSDYFNQLYVAAVSWETYLSDIVRLWPNHNIICGSDFDHGDTVSTWPNTVAPIQAISGLSDEDKGKILGGNALRLFGFDKHPERLRRIQGIRSFAAN